jgi:hypothetical protein
MRLYKARKVFCNLQDSVAGLTEALEESFSDIQIDILGCVAHSRSEREPVASNGS